eukprot:9466173-Pyramimonas_sp.AAC.1
MFKVRRSRKYEEDVSSRIAPAPCTLIGVGNGLCSGSSPAMTQSSSCSEPAWRTRGCEDEGLGFRV